MQSRSGKSWPNGAQKRWVYVAIALGLLVNISPPLLSASGLRINLSASMPRGLYIIIPLNRSLKKGDTIAACPPYSAALLGRERGYLGPGVCPEGVEPLLKLVVAVPGDAVTISDRGVSVNGALLPESRCLAKDGDGRSLHGWTIEHYSVQAKMLWLYAPLRQSWDSRYWGPLSVRNVEGLASAILVLPASSPLSCSAKRACHASPIPTNTDTPRPGQAPRISSPTTLAHPRH